MNPAVKKGIFLIVGIFSLVLLIILFFVVLYFLQRKVAAFSAVLESMCGTRPGFEVVSPDGKHRAVIYEYDCGAMDGFSTQISVVPIESANPSKGGTAFTATGGKRLGHWHGPYVEVKWETSSVLKVKYDSNAQVFTKSSTN